MSKKNNGKGDAIVEFDALELEGEGDDLEPSKSQIMLATLKEKLEPSDYADLMTKLGIAEDISNADLLEAITALFEGAKPGEEKEKPEGEEGEGDEKEMMDRKDFIKKCMEEGKDLKTCTAEFDEKYPDPGKKDEAADADELGEKKGEDSDLAKRFKDLEAKFAALEKKDELSEVSAAVDKLVEDKHMAPVQRELALKLADGLAPEKQAEMLEFFRTTQKFAVHQDVGVLGSVRPGQEGAANMTVERKRELMKLHGIDGLISDKADKSKLPWEENN